MFTRYFKQLPTMIIQLHSIVLPVSKTSENKNDSCRIELEAEFWVVIHLPTRGRHMSCVYVCMCVCVYIYLYVYVHNTLFIILCTYCTVLHRWQKRKSKFFMWIMSLRFFCNSEAHTSELQESLKDNFLWFLVILILNRSKIFKISVFLL